MDILERGSERTCYPESSDVCKLLRQQSTGAQALQAVIDQAPCTLSRAIDAEQRRIRTFAKHGVASGRFAERAGGRSHIQNIVHDLECKSDVSPIAVESFHGS